MRKKTMKSLNAFDRYRCITGNADLNIFSCYRLAKLYINNRICQQNGSLVNEVKSVIPPCIPIASDVTATRWLVDEYET